MQQRLVVIGTGFAGMNAALSAARLRDAKGVSPDELEIAVISPQPVLVIRPRLYEPAPETLIPRCSSNCSAVLDGVRDVFVSDLRFIDRRLVGWGELEGDALVAFFEGGVELASDVRMVVEPLALGRRGGVFRTVARGHLAAGGGEMENVYVTLFLADTGRVIYGENIRRERRGGCARALRGDRRRDGGSSAPSLASAEPATGVTGRPSATATPRPTNWWTAARSAGSRSAVPAGMVAMYRSWDEIAPDVELWFEALSSGDVDGTAHVSGRGHAVDGGGAMEYSVTAALTIRDGRLTRTEMFDVGEEPAALARVEELRRITGSPSERPTTARAVCSTASPPRTTPATGTASANRSRRRCASSTGGWSAGVSSTGPRPCVEIFEGAIELAPDVQMVVEPLALGRQAVVFRTLAGGHLAVGGGEFTLDYATLIVLRGGRVAYVEQFNSGDAGLALARFEEVGAATESERLFARLCRFVNARDWNAVESCIADEFELADGRALGWEALRGAEAMVAIYRSWVEVAPDVDARFEALASDDHGIAVRFGGRGHAADGGGEFEYFSTSVSVVRDGRFTRTEMFEDGDEAAALARYEELRREQHAPRPTAGPPELLERYVTAVNARDFDALRGVYAPDVRMVDRRLIGWGEREGADAIIETLRGTIALAADLHLEAERTAAGAGAGVVRQLWRGHFAEGGGPFEVEMLALAIVQDELYTRVEIFEGTEMDAALARFEEIGAQTEPERVVARVARLVNARDWDALGDCYAEDQEAVDRRVLAWEPLRGPGATVDMYRSWAEVAPDFEIRFETLAGDDERAVVRYGGYGHAADGGGAMEYVITSVVTVRDGREQHAELFGADEASSALARYEELRHSPGAPDRRRRRRSSTTASPLPTTSATGSPCGGSLPPTSCSWTGARSAGARSTVTRWWRYSREAWRVPPTSGLNLEHLAVEGFTDRSPRMLAAVTSPPAAASSRSSWPR